MNSHSFKGAATSVSAARILVVDDEPMVGELLHDMLRLLGYEVEFCTSPSRALDILASSYFDLVLSDFCMPQMSGQEFFDQATAANESLTRRIIFITGDAESEETRFFLKSTSSLHLSKPFQFAEIKDMIEQALRTTAPALDRA